VVAPQSVSADCLKTKEPLMSNKYLDKLIKDSSDKQLFNKSYTPTKSIKSTVNIYSFKTFWTMKKEREESNASILIWSVIYALSFLTLFFLFASNSTEFYHKYLKIFFILLSALCVFRILYYYLQTMITYPFYINWIKRMPFTITGWSGLFSYDGFYDHETWIKECTLSISCKPCSDYYRNALYSSLLLFCNKANRTFVRYHDGNLITWKNNRDSISGSCNCKIIGKLFRYIIIDLKKIHNITNIIDSVNIEIDNIVVNASEVETANSAAST